MKVANLVLGILCVSGLAYAVPDKANQSNPGFVEAPAAGKKALTLEQVPTAILHTADVTFRGYDARFTVMSAQLDLDAIEPIYEIRAKGSNGRILEADVMLNGKVEEVEIQVTREEVPGKVLRALSTFAPNFEAADETPAIEKSIRPSANGLLEVWYEFSGTNYDVEVRSDAKAVLIEPA